MAMESVFLVLVAVFVVAELNVGETAAVSGEKIVVKAKRENDELAEKIKLYVWVISCACVYVTVFAKK